MPPPIFGPHEGETYAQYLERLKPSSVEEYSPASKAAALMTTVMMMGGGKNKPIEREQLNRSRRELQQSAAFNRMMKDPKAMELLRNNDSAGLFTLFGELEAKRQQELDRKYRRPDDKQLVAADAQLLNSAMEGLKKNAGSAPATGSPEAERRGKLYREMMKRLEYAKSLAEKGIQLTGEQTKELITSIKAYNNGGKKYVKPGGEKQAEGFTESMTLLKNYMPAAEFNRYCRQINFSRGVQSPANENFVAPESFEAQRLSGWKTARELMAENRERMRTSFTLDTAAEALAIRQLAGNNPNKLIRPEELQAQKARLKEPGTAFMKVMMDDKARENIRDLAEMGEAEEVVGDLTKAMEKRQAEAERELREQARKAVVRSAQGEINRSIRHLTNGSVNNRYFTEQYLANILASEQLAMNARGDEKITVGAFRERAEQLRQDPAFQRLADRYVNDPDFRENMNRGLERDHSALSLANAYKLEQQPVRPRRDQAQPEAAPEQENRAPVRRQEELQRQPIEQIPELEPIL